VCFKVLQATSSSLRQCGATRPNAVQCRGTLTLNHTSANVSCKVSSALHVCPDRSVLFTHILLAGVVAVCCSECSIQLQRSHQNVYELSLKFSLLCSIPASQRLDLLSSSVARGLDAIQHPTPNNIGGVLRPHASMAKMPARATWSSGVLVLLVLGVLSQWAYASTPIDPTSCTHHSHHHSYHH
jgi:hypothetical protein